MSMKEASEQLTLAKNAFQAEDWDTAEQICLQIIRQDSQQVEALEMLGMVYCQVGQFDRAIEHYQSFLALTPDHASAHYNLGTAFSKIEQMEAAIEHYQAAIALDSTFYQSHYNLGNAYLAQHHNEEAIAAYRQALGLKPDHRQSLHNLGACLQSLDQFEAAAIAYQQALALKSDHAIAHNSLGEILRKLGRVDDAIEHLKRAIAIDPDFAEAHNNLGVAYYYRGQFEEADDCYQNALRLDSNYANAQLNHGFLLLLKGDLQTGFRHYEQRWTGQSLTPPSFPQPQWDGANLNGKTIFLCHEQGFGDTIQFIRYAPLVAERGGRVIVGCSAPLMRLLKTAPGIDQLVLEGEPLPPFDCYALLLSLPYLLGTTLDAIPAAIPYLSAPDLPNPNARLKVGIVWGGNSKNGNDRDRSISLTDLLPLLSLTGVEFYSLQKDRSEELQQFREMHPLIAIVDLDEQLEDFADTAAAIAPLDLMISVDTSVAHLAGAMGKSVWILLCAVPDWRWFLDRADSPWYPTAQLFRQHCLGDWSSVTQSVVDQLSEMIENSSQEFASSSDQSSNSGIIKPLETKKIGIGFPIGGSLGWGVYGLNLALQLLKIPHLEPVPLVEISTLSELNPVLRSRLNSVLHYPQQIQTLLAQNPDKILNTDFLILKPLGNHFATSDDNHRIQGSHNVGVIFSEDTQFLPHEIEQAKRYDRIIAGSDWNAEILRSYGLTQVETVQQGIDPTLFHPASKSGLLHDRFVIFSGGKLEHRKGQDIVVAAFRIFRSRHPEALLLMAWHNHWLHTMTGLDRAKHVIGLPTVDARGQLQITRWLTKNGIPADAVLDVGRIPNAIAPQILREADVAVFPNRAEGGTNLVAMESLACGIPTILSANTGHLDLIQPDRCYPLRTQRQVVRSEHYHGTEGWGESDVEEVVEQLEQVYRDRSEAQRRGTAAAQFMQNWTWEIQVQRCLKVLADFL